MKNSKKTLEKRNKLKREWYDKLKDTNFPKFILKECKDCGIVKECQWNSSFTQTGVPEYKARCVECHKKNINTHRRTKQAKELRKLRRKKLLIKRKQMAVNMLGGKCKVCGYNKSLSALTFHHKNPEEKEFSIGRISDISWDKVIKELEKCELLCFNCHMELHEKWANCD